MPKWSCLEKLKNKELETVIQTMRIYSHNIGTEFGREKYAMHIMKSGKREKKTKGIDLLNQERIKTLEKKENYKYLGLLKMNTLKQAENKEKIRKYFR